MLLVLAFAAITAAAPTTAATPTTSSWAAAANRACGTVNAEIRRLPKVTSTRVLIADLQATGKLASWEYARLAAIQRPPSEGTAIASLLATLRTETHLIVAQFIPAVQRGDQAVTSRLAAKNDRLNKQFNRLALALRAPVCAQNPQPSG